MSRSDGVHRTNVRNSKICDANVANTQSHNEREKESYSNQDIVPDRTQMNVHFKRPTTNYMSIFEKMVYDKVISTRGLKPDAIKFGELIFDVNSYYFESHRGYDFAKKFYADAYDAAVKIVGGEEYILSAVMHADERNRALSDAFGKDVYHYHMHVVYVPVVPKDILWTKRCKNSDLAGTVKEKVMQVSMSKKWASKPALDENGKPMQTPTGKTILKPSYAVLQDDFFNHMKSGGYTDLERGEQGSMEEHLTITQFKVMKERERLEEIKKKNINIQRIDKIEAKHTLLGNKLTVNRDDFDMLIAAAKKYIVQEKKENMLQRALDAANKLIDELKKMIADLTEKLTAVYKDLLRCKYENEQLNNENNNLRMKIHTYDDVISQNNLSAFFHFQKEIYRENDDER